MTDIHTHILPQMDDGSQSAAESLAMLEESARQGITCIAATPHFYAQENSPAEFLRRRAVSAGLLKEIWNPGLPEVRLGAEVCYFDGMSRSEGMEALCIEGTELLLLEMPFCPWSRRALREVWELQARTGLRVMLAHVERYLRWQTAETWDMLEGWGVLNQCSASFFLRWQTRHRALKLLRKGRVHMLGSDCHNMKNRPPRLGEALALLQAGDRERLEENEKNLLGRGGWDETLA